ncbi:hypothetical protein AK88_04600 [Plasmodium fragile]|uniref:Schizont-infected cell agglutination extracellular alpha domain-containing protein n=1 Tax=Plasmodium fragile TaxID=5857 RepID=A0A0D9QFK6_PLAFR|nr:uncharacterized protein AK88_04600 [Plasmodium fragile]KJP85784.1 hypothetical protein AK88_04600 [Plasmodium fragile]
MKYATLGALLAHYVKTRGLVDKHEQYTEFLRTDVTVLLEEFVAHMQRDIVENYAANCLNVGYTKEHHGDMKFVAKVGDRIICTLMTGALFFMNGWHKQSASTDHTDRTSEALKEHIRCAIVNIFMYILNESPCKSDMGTYYAWYTMRKMEPDLGGGLIKQGKCRKGVFTDIKIEEFDMQQMIKSWLQKNVRIQDTIGGKAMKSTCTKTLAGSGRAKQDADATDDNTDLRQDEKDAIRELGRGLKTIVEEVKKEVTQCAQDTGACMESIEAVSRSNPENDKSKAIVSKSVERGIPAPTVAASKDRGEKAPIRPATYRIAQYGCHNMHACTAPQRAHGSHNKAHAATTAARV